MARTKTRRRRGGRQADHRGTPILLQAPKEPTAEVQATPEVAQGRYCNVAVINHTKREFSFDFIYLVGNRGTLVARIATSPAHAKQLHSVLGKNLTLYERNHGGIDTT